MKYEILLRVRTEDVQTRDPMEYGRMLAGQLRGFVGVEDCVPVEVKRLDSEPCGCSLDGRCDVHKAMMKVIHQAWNDLEMGTAQRLYAKSDGYGAQGYVPVQGYDWSGIRDSSPKAIEDMYQVAVQALHDYEVAALNALRRASK